MTGTPIDAALEKAAAAISSANQVALACHVSPDGDALGSLLALHLLCLDRGVPSVASWPEPHEVAPHYRFLPGLETTTKAADFPSEPAVMITFDSGSIDRLGSLEAAARAAGQLIVIDHHATNSAYGSINVIDPQAAATAVIVRRLAGRLGWALTRDAAECLFTGLVTDTGRFQHAGTPEVFSLAAELAAFDLPISRITRELFEKHRFVYLRMAGEALAGAELDPDLGLVVARVTRADLDRFGVTLDEAEGLIDLVRRTAEARVAMVAKEGPDGVRVSLRSLEEGSDPVDVGALAIGLGGGGHRHAAGFTRRGTVEEAVQAVRQALGAAARR